MINAIVISMLTIESVSDFRKRTISTIRIFVFFLVAIGLNVFLNYQNLWSILGGMFIGGMLLLYAKITGEGIGYGDGCVFVCLGAFLGISDNLRLLFFSLLLAAVCGGIYAISHGKSIRVKIPFIPFVLVTEIAICVVRRIAV